MNFYTYKITRDYGFAPNPFFGICTLATCKPDIRKKAQIGDWIFGTGSSELNNPYTLIFAMKVSNIITFNEYWFDPIYNRKKPNMNYSLVQMYGDNIYHKSESGDWNQANSHHSNEDGSLNKKNLKTDTTKTENVLISNQFYYFGRECITIPEELKHDLYNLGRNYKEIKNHEAANTMIKYLENKFVLGYQAKPILFDKFKRHLDG